ncbi:MAG: hypothetical protein EOM20_17555, partial [Spartobacteria bacterium]|nr:hypothetical protein [Spartobacteria bacterium]
PNQYLVIARDVATLIAKYPQLNAANCIGDFSGSLSDRGEQLLLLAPDTPDLASETCLYLVDEVRYYDGGHGRDYADGLGSSLELRDPHSDNRLIHHWSASDERGKSAWSNYTFTGVINGGQLPSGTSIDTVSLMSIGGEGECLVDDIRVIYSSANRVINSTFESSSAQWSFQGNHIQSSRSNEGYGASSYSLCLKSTGSGDTRVNRCIGNLSVNLGGVAVSLSLNARWLAGSPVLLMWIRGGYLEMTCPLVVPDNLGTPGQQNSCYTANEGPAVYNVTHVPALPAVDEAVTVYAQAYDPDGVAGLTLRYRTDPSPSISGIAMTQDAWGVYSAALPAQPADTMLAFHIEAVDLAAVPATQYYPEGAPTKECLVQFDNPIKGGILGQYTIWMSRTNMTLWQHRYALSDEPLDITFVCGDRIIYNANIRYRGSPFLRPGYGDPETGWAAYRVGLPKDNRFLDSDELALDWQEPYRDSTYQRERAAMWIGHKMGLPTFYKRFVSVVLNGLGRGFVYSDSQGIDADFVEARYPDIEKGDLHKINDWFSFDNAFTNFSSRDASLVNYTYSGVKQKPRYRWCWEKKKVGVYDDSYSNLFALVDAANLSGDTYTRAMENQVDVDQWMGIVCFRHLVGDWDSFGYDRGKNMYGFCPEGGKWILYPWDVDFCLGSYSSGSPTDDFFKVESGVMPRMDAMINHAPFKRYYRQWFYKAVTGPFDAAAIGSVLEGAYAGLAGNGIEVDGPADIETWISDRNDYIESELDYYTNVSLTIYEGDFSSTSNRVTITGSAPIQCKIITVMDQPSECRWVFTSEWESTLALTSGLNHVTVVGCDEGGVPIPGQSDTITITWLGGPDPDPADHLVINEIMYHPAAPYGEFIEIFNTSTNYTFDLFNYRMDGVDLTFDTTTLIAPQAYLVIVESAADFSRIYSNSIPVAAQWAGALDNAGETITLQQLDTNGLVIAVIDRVTYDDTAPWPVEADGEGPSLQLIDPAQDNDRAGNWGVDTSPRYTPGAANSVTSTLPAFPLLWINELQPVNSNTLQDGQGDYDPWIELYNAGTGDVDLATYYLSDDYNQLDKWPFPPGAVIVSNQFMIIWADGEPHETAGGEYHTSFILSPTNGYVALAQSNAGHTVLIDYLPYSAVPGDQSYGDYPDGVASNRAQFYYPTPGGTNNNAVPPVRIFINEWMAKNDTGIIDPATGSPADWFELYNAESFDVDITGYALSDNPADPNEFIITGSTILTGGEYRLVWADDIADNTWGTNDLHVPFKLSASGDSIALFDTAQVIVDTVTFGSQGTDITQGRYPDGDVSIITLGVPTPWAMNRLSTNPIIFTSCGAYGAVSPTGRVYVSMGQDQSFSMVADRYYGIQDVLTNGVSTGGPFGMPSNTYTWVAVQTDGTFHVEFSELLATNGVPQWWLAQFGWTNNFDAAALDDPDHDQAATWAEYVAGTNPTNTASVFHVDLATTNRPPVIISWPSVTGRLYTLEYTTDASAPYSTLGAASNIPATPAWNTYTNTGVTNAANLFYRVKVKQQ